MANFTIQDTVSLPPSGNPIPRLGLGVYRATGNKCVNAIVAAMKAGYRHVDSAQFYHNEAETGEGVRKSGVPRSEIFVTTKMMQPTGSADETYADLKASVEKTGLGYVNLFLIHSPQSGPQGRRTLWAALERLKEEGLTKDIGVSNYGVHHLKEMKEYARVYPPATNQIELHPWFQQKDIVAYCESEGIPVEAYSPLVRQEKSDDLTLLEVAKKLGKAPNQILVRWSLQHGFIPLPKSEDPSRIAANAGVFDFEIPKDEMEKLDSLDQGKNGAITWTPQFGA